MTAAAPFRPPLTFLMLLTCLFTGLLAFASVALAVTLPDPTGDAVGNGSLALPTAPVYRRNAFDLLSVEVQDAPNLALDVTMASLDNPWRLPNGFSLPVIEIYLDTADDAGRTELLYGEQGSRMSLPAGVAWDYAFYVTGDAFRVFSGETGEPVDVTGEVGATITREGTTLRLTTRLSRPAQEDLYAVVGSYDPLTASGWRPVTRTPSPGTLSSPTQVVRAVDVLADTLEAQEGAINSGVLPRPARRATRTPQNSGWLLLSAAGLLLSLVGLVIRARIRAPRAPVRLVDAPSRAREESHAEKISVEKNDVEVEAPTERVPHQAPPKEHAPQRYTTVPVEAPEPPLTPPAPAPAKAIPVLELPLYTPTIVGASVNASGGASGGASAEAPQQPDAATPVGEGSKEQGLKEQGERPEASESPAPPVHPPDDVRLPPAVHSPRRDAPPDRLSTFGGALDESPDSDWRIWSKSPGDSKARDD